jgi:hypothetical protein
MTTADAAERPASARGGVLARHPLVFYFLMAYAGTWLVTVPLALSANGVGLLPFRFRKEACSLSVLLGSFWARP